MHFTNRCPGRFARANAAALDVARSAARVVLPGALLALVVSSTAVVSTGCAPTASSGAQAIPAQKRFDSPEDAVQAFVEVAQRGDVVAARAFFGPGVEELESDSFEKTEGDLQRFAAAYDRRHQLLIDEVASDGSASDSSIIERVTLAVGDDLWEFPVPLVRDGTPPAWRFDTAAGVANVLAARFAEHRDQAIGLLLECIPAQEDYRRLAPEGRSTFAKRFRSDRGERNGLWWPDDLAPPVSPIGPMVDEAVALAGAPVDPWSVRSYRGYTFRILTGAGASAPGGTQDWLDAGGSLVGGFAFLAWPAGYGETGVESVLVAMDGTVWVSDLGPDTPELVESITRLDPGTGWTPLRADG